jgi:serine protease Do
MNAMTELSRHARAALLGGVLLLAGAGVVINQSAGAGDDKSKPELRLVVDNQPLERQGTPLQASFAPVVKTVAPSVVSITTETTRRIEGMPSPFGQPWFREFFGGDIPPMVQRQQGLGSGVILTEDGYILTNNHVVEGADQITVVLNPDAREYTARVVGRDPKSDIAVVKIDATGLPAIRIGDSAHVEVGDVVLAIGNPFGIGQTVTMGIVGATSRAVFGQAMGLEYEDFIQTDAAINQGNSGGALVDAQGRLIGINTAILSRSGGNNGVGFAVPINLARSVTESIVTHGKVVRGFLGVSLQPLTPSLAEEFGTKDTRGALVSDVVPQGPAAKAGIKAGDVVTHYRDREVRDARHLMLMVGQTTPGESVNVELLRNGKKETVDIVLKERPDNLERASLRKSQVPSDTSVEDTGGLQGVVVGDLTPEIRQRHRVPSDIDGALITDVSEESAAWDAGLRPGDVIRQVNRRSVTDAESAIEAVQGLENARIRVRIWREGGHHFVVVDERKTE